MDGERLGPLSYSVTPPEGEPSAQRAILVGASVIVAIVVTSMIAGWFVLGKIEHAALVVNGAPVVILGAGIGVALWQSGSYLRQARKTALVVVTGLALLAALFTNRMLGQIKPALPQVRASVDAIDLPPGFRMISEETFGDRLCRRGCPSVERRYSAPVADPDPVSTLILAMFDQGWEPTDPGIDRPLATTARKGGLSAHLSENERHVVQIRVTRR